MHDHPANLPGPEDLILTVLRGRTQGVVVSQYLPALLPGRAQAVLVAERPFDSATKLASFSFEDGR
jgi:hypothetical protein